MEIELLVMFQNTKIHFPGTYFKNYHIAHADLKTA